MATTKSAWSISCWGCEDRVFEVFFPHFWRQFPDMSSLMRTAAADGKQFSVLGLEQAAEQVVLHTPGAVFTGRAEFMLGSLLLFDGASTSTVPVCPPVTKRVNFTLAEARVVSDPVPASWSTQPVLAPRGRRPVSAAPTSSGRKRARPAAVEGSATTSAKKRGRPVGSGKAKAASEATPSSGKRRGRPSKHLAGAQPPSDAPSEPDLPVDAVSLAAVAASAPQVEEATVAAVAALADDAATPTAPEDATLVAKPARARRKRAADEEPGAVGAVDTAARVTRPQGPADGAPAGSHVAVDDADAVAPAKLARPHRTVVAASTASSVEKPAGARRTRAATLAAAVPDTAPRKKEGALKKQGAL